MHISVTGISHQSTPVELRERFAFTAEQLPDALRLLPSDIGGGVILSTCNRTELYLASESPIDRDEAVAALLASRSDTAPEGIEFYHSDGIETVRHLFRVTGGIESLVVGESEILGQVREAFSAATAAESANPVLARLFHSALRSGRRARSETEIGAHGLSVSSLAVSLSRKALGDLSPKTVLVVGAGEAGQRAAGALVQSGVGRLLVTTRRSGLAQELAQSLNGTVIAMEDLGSALVEADVVISCTAAPDAIISRDQISAAMSGRPDRPLVIVDIAVPRDVEGSARNVPDVHLFDIDDLQAAAETNLDARRQEVGAVEAIVEDEVARFEAWLAAHSVTPTIAALEQQAESIRRAEVARTLSRLTGLSDDEKRRVEAMSKALVKRLLHQPVTRLRSQGSARQIDALRDLFALDAPESDISD